MSALDEQIGGRHYKELAIQPAVFSHANRLTYIEGCVVKYISRWRNKGGIADLEKAKHYIEMLIELEAKVEVSDIQVTAIHPERWGNDLDVVNAARVSFRKEAEFEEHIHLDKTFYVLSEKDRKLINYLAKHKHFSPFNHSFISVRVKAPIFVARQLVKHKFMPWNEVSRRYVDEEPEFYIPDAWRLRADNVKQGSSEEILKDSNTDNQFDAYNQNCLYMYEWLLDKNVAPEQARMVLPQNIHTEWIWSGTLGAFCDMLVLRLDPHTQYESRIVANKIKELIEPVFPVSLKARLENA